MKSLQLPLLFIPAVASGAQDPREACASLAAAPRLATVVTDAARGCYCMAKSGSNVQHYPAFKVDVFDSNGCGDTFHGAFALAIARRLTIEEAITFASAAAALKAEAAGGRRRGWDALPSLDEVLQFLRENLDERAKTRLLKGLETLRKPAP